MTEKPSNPYTVKTNIRFPAKLYAELKDAALRADHSINTEVVSRCTAASGGASLASLAQQNEQLRADIMRLEALVQSIIAAISPRR